jgi:hypothetical protein
LWTTLKLNSVGTLSGIFKYVDFPHLSIHNAQK